MSNTRTGADNTPLEEAPWQWRHTKFLCPFRAQRVEKRKLQNIKRLAIPETLYRTLAFAESQPYRTQFPEAVLVEKKL